MIMKRLVVILVVLCYAIAALPVPGGTPLAASAAAVSAPIKVVLDGVELQFDVPPATISDRTMVPMRAIFEALGALVYWDNANSIVTAIRGVDVVKVAIGNDSITINGHPNTMDVAPVVIDGRTLVPARFISEALGCDVRWDERSNTVFITSGRDTLPRATLEKLLVNRAKMIPFRNIAHYNGQVYAAEFMCMPGWNSVNSNYIGSFAIHNSIMYRTAGNGTGEEFTELYASTLGGSRETYVGEVGNWGNNTYIIGDRLVYTGFLSDYEGDIYDYEAWGTNVIDLNSPALTKMSIYRDGRIISFDDEYIYYLEAFEVPSIEYWRASWDGSRVEKLDELDGMPSHFFDWRMPDSDGQYLFMPVYGNTTSMYGHYYDDGIVGINLVAIKGLEQVKYLPFDAINHTKMQESILVNDGWVYYHNESAVYRMNLNSGQSTKVCDLHPDIELAIARYVDVIDGYLYMQGYTGEGPSFNNMALFRVRAGGGTMENTGKTWFES